MKQKTLIHSYMKLKGKRTYKLQKTLFHSTAKIQPLESILVGQDE
jgi:hypothetical protein